MQPVQNIQNKAGLLLPGYIPLYRTCQLTIIPGQYIIWQLCAVTFTQSIYGSNVAHSAKQPHVCVAQRQQKVTNNSYRKMTLYNSNEHCKLQHSTLLCVNTLSGPLITATVISSHTDCILYLFNTAGSVKWVAMDCMIWVRLLAAAQICIPTTTSTSALQFAQLSIQQYLYHVLMYTSTRLKVETNDSSLSSANI